LDGKSTYHSHFIVKKKSGIKNISDMKGKKIALVSKSTACGYLFPLSYFRQNGINNFEEYFGEVFYAGSHDAVINALFIGNADIGVVKNTVYDAFMDKNQSLKQDVYIFTESPEFPTSAVFVSHDLSPEITTKLKDAFLNMHKKAQGQKSLEEFGALKFEVLDSNIDYLNVYKVIEEAGLNINEYDFQHNSTENK